MGEVIHRGAPFEMPVMERKASEPRASFCPPIARMVEEHVWIKRLLARIPDLLDALGRDWAGTAPQVERCLEFIRTYADRYHHAKEEDLLFTYFDRDSAILRGMCRDHAEGRDHVRNVAEALAVSELARVEHHLRAYGELLAGHIQREGTILYPWMDRSLSTRQVGELYSACIEVERRFGSGPADQAAFVVELEARFRS